MSDDYIDQQNAVPVEKPAGAPEFLPLLRLPRRKRGPVVAKVMRLAKAQEEFGGDSDDDTLEIDVANMEPEKVEAMFGLLADIEDVLRGVAVSGDEFEGWAEAADDRELAQAFAYYLKTFQMGEAQASRAS